MHTIIIHLKNKKHFKNEQKRNNCLGADKTWINGLLK